MDRSLKLNVTTDDGIVLRGGQVNITIADRVIDPPGNIVVTEGYTTANISWDAVSGATLYFYKLSTTPEDVSSPGNTATLSNNFTGLTHNTTYWFKALAYDGTNSKVSVWSLPFKLKTKKFVSPRTIIPTQVGSTISVTWDAVPDAVTYDLSYDSTPAVYADTLSSGTNSGVTPTLTLNQQYYISVRTVYADGTSGWSGAVPTYIS